MIKLTRMMSRTDIIILQQKRVNQGAHTRLWVITTSLKRLWVITTSLQSQKIKHNGTSKTRPVSETPTLVNSDFYIGKRQK